MKKSILVLSAIAGIVYLSSCGGNEQPTEAPGYTQMQLDSIKKATEDSIAAANALAKDSLLNKMAEDSIAAANAAAAAAANSGTKTGNKPAPAKPGTTKPTTPTKPAEPVKETPRTQEQIKADKKKAEFGDAAAKARLEQDKKNKKAAEFGNQEAQKKVDEVKASKKAAEFNK